MCGIVGCQLNRPLNESDVAQIRSIRDAMTHRGPDGYGEFIEPEKGVYLGHRRLAILDLDPRSAQPMQRHDLAITFNGEIYNFIELRENLTPGFNFETKGDTEVILHAWKKQGSACLQSLEGMYAFALRDAEGVHLVTDYFNEKPLYLLHRPEGFYFASEPQPLIQAFDLLFDNDHDAQIEFLNFGFLRAPRTGYQNLEVLEPASHLTIKPSGDLIRRRYWHLPEAKARRGALQPLSHSDQTTIKDLLCVSLERALRADVPLGLFLSGGIDSALLAALIAKELGREIQTYTVAFRDGANEENAAAAIAHALNIPHTVIVSAQGNAHEETPESLLDFYGAPNDNTTAFSVYQMCAQAKKYLTVAISGLGADEIFYGYNKYEFLYQQRNLYAQSAWLYPMARLAAQVGMPKARLAADLLHGNWTRQYLRLKNGMAQKDIQNYGGSIFENRSMNFFEQVRNFDLQETMPQNLIPSVDRGSMRASVEVRSPYLNRKLVEFMASLDPRALIAFGKKWVLRDLLAQYIPVTLISQNKQGFVYPLTRYFPGDFLDESQRRMMLRERLWQGIVHGKN